MGLKSKVKYVTLTLCLSKANRKERVREREREKREVSYPHLNIVEQVYALKVFCACGKSEYV